MTVTAVTFFFSDSALCVHLSALLMSPQSHFQEMLKFKREELRAESSRLHFRGKKQKTKTLFVGIEHLWWNSWRKWGKVSSILIFLFLRWNLRCIYNRPQQPVYPVKQTTSRGHPTLNLLSSGHVFQSKCSVIGHFFPLFSQLTNKIICFSEKFGHFLFNTPRNFFEKMIYFFINQLCSNLTQININLHEICIPTTVRLECWKDDLHNK